MRFTLKVFIALVISGFAYALWVVQPDRLSLKQIERNIAAAQFSEVEELLNAGKHNTQLQVNGDCNMHAI